MLEVRISKEELEVSLRKAIGREPTDVELEKLAEHLNSLYREILDGDVRGFYDIYEEEINPPPKPKEEEEEND